LAGAAAGAGVAAGTGAGVAAAVAAAGDVDAHADTANTKGTSSRVVVIGRAWSDAVGFAVKARARP